MKLDLTKHDLIDIGQSKWNAKHEKFISFFIIFWGGLLVLSTLFYSVVYDGLYLIIPMIINTILGVAIALIMVRKQTKSAKMFAESNTSDIDINESEIKMLGRSYWIRYNAKRIILGLVFWLVIANIPGILLIIFTHNRYNIATIIIDISIFIVSMVYLRKFIQSGNKYYEKIKEETS